MILFDTHFNKNNFYKNFMDILLIKKENIEIKQIIKNFFENLNLKFYLKMFDSKNFNENEKYNFNCEIKNFEKIYKKFIKKKNEKKKKYNFNENENEIILFQTIKKINYFKKNKKEILFEMEELKNNNKIILNFFEEQKINLEDLLYKLEKKEHEKNENENEENYFNEIENYFISLKNIKKIKIPFKNHFKIFNNEENLKLFSKEIEK